jgi:hypothetical protein
MLEMCKKCKKQYSVTVTGIVHFVVSISISIAEDQFDGSCKERSITESRRKGMSYKQ